MCFITPCTKQLGCVHVLHDQPSSTSAHGGSGHHSAMNGLCAVFVHASVCVCCVLCVSARARVLCVHACCVSVLCAGMRVCVRVVRACVRACTVLLYAGHSWLLCMCCVTLCTTQLGAARVLHDQQLTTSVHGGSGHYGAMNGVCDVFVRASACAVCCVRMRVVCLCCAQACVRAYLCVRACMPAWQRVTLHVRPAITHLHARWQLPPSWLGRWGLLSRHPGQQVLGRPATPLRALASPAMPQSSDSAVVCAAATQQHSHSAVQQCMLLCH